MRKAVIDMGTNTFHALVLEKEEGADWKPVFRKRFFVRLAADGLNIIGEQSWERAMAAMIYFREVFAEQGVRLEDVLAFGTAGIRSAENASEFIKAVKKKTGITVLPISGEREAELIYMGVRQAVPWPENTTALVMDIGGGSVEFILADEQEIFWRGSYNTGVAVLYNEFHKSDPIASDEIKSIEQFIEKELSELWLQAQKFKPKTLIGAAGAFDTIDFFALNTYLKPPKYGYLSAEEFKPLYKLFTRSTLQERKDMPRLLPERVEMVVAAMILIQYVLAKLDIRDIYTSEYSMKEGMLLEL